ncbi:hypothetical protein O4J56_10885 [Nocardiopsis sp. RSe5-2]|uniref:Flp family type IVb pilin n=1 Tax=Nocardiopsis endophytica TaxID=3018445 RepID=A0ABT4U2G5_9ACTN|nr:hypothetical protein [Nocardiopsis endophytica]MDA2811142.1 hypothetical protein [Nocardiopsis endophytica]
MLDLRTKMNDFVAKRRAKKEDKGAGFMEYGAIILLVAAIATAVLGLGLDDTIKGWFKDSVDEIEKEAGAGGGGGGNEEEEEEGGNG